MLNAAARVNVAVPQLQTNTPIRKSPGVILMGSARMHVALANVLVKTRTTARTHVITSRNDATATARMTCMTGMLVNTYFSRMLKMPVKTHAVPDIAGAIRKAVMRRPNSALAALRARKPAILAPHQNKE